MKILHILATPRAEGTPNLVLDWLATGLHEQEVFVLHSEPGDLKVMLQSASLHYEEATYFFDGPRKFTNIALGIYRICKKRQPDLVICWPAGFANWVCMGARLARVRQLLVHAGNPPNRNLRGAWMTRFGLWPVILMGGKVICCSDYVRSQFLTIRGIPASCLHKVWNCIRVEHIKERSQITRSSRQSYPPSERFPTAIMVATLESHKDHSTLFHAVPAILEEIPNFRLLLVGAGSLRNELEILVRTLNLCDSIRFLGMRNDVPELLGIADLFVLSTTTQEGLGSVLLEAMAAGLPIIASDVPACSEVLEKGKYGTLVPPEDSSAMATSIIRSITQATSMAQLKETTDYVSDFDAIRMMDQYLSIAGGSISSHLLFRP